MLVQKYSEMSGVQYFGPDLPAKDQRVSRIARTRRRRRRRLASASAESYSRSPPELSARPNVLDKPRLLMDRQTVIKGSVSDNLVDRLLPLMRRKHWKHVGRHCLT